MRRHPLATNEHTSSSTPLGRRWRGRTIWGSNGPISGAPGCPPAAWASTTVLDLEPLRSCASSPCAELERLADDGVDELEDLEGSRVRARVALTAEGGHPGGGPCPASRAASRVDEQTNNDNPGLSGTIRSALARIGRVREPWPCRGTSGSMGWGVTSRS